MSFAFTRHSHLSTLFAEVVAFSDSLAQTLIAQEFPNLGIAAAARLPRARKAAMELPAIIKEMQTRYHANFDVYSQFAPERSPLPPVDPTSFKVAMHSVEILVQQSTDIVLPPQIRAFYKEAIAKTADAEQAIANQFKLTYTPLNQFQRQLMFKDARGHQLAAILALRS